MKPTAFFLLIVIICFSPQAVMAQHVHGVIQVGVVVDGSTAAVSLNAPMSDVVGFEHEPKGEEQVSKIRKAATMLADPDAMFGLPDSAKCKVSGSSIDGPAYVKQHVEEEGADAAGHGHEHHDDHHSHGHDSEHEEHTEINANYEWACGDASKLDVLELRFTEGFANVETIEIQLLTDAGAQVMTREGRVASIPLSSK